MILDSKKRREIDKETMFNKIMPTHLLDPDAGDDDDIRVETVKQVIVKQPPEEPKQVVHDPPISEPAAPPEPPAPAQPEPEPEPAPAPEPEPEPEPPKPKKRTRTTKKKAAETPERRYINLTELLVLGKLESMMDKFKCCRCDACRQAIALHALNTLPPQYCYATDDEIKEMILRCDCSAVIACMVQGIMQVRANPPHTPGEAQTK